MGAQTRTRLLVLAAPGNGNGSLPREVCVKMPYRINRNGLAILNAIN